MTWLFEMIEEKDDDISSPYASLLSENTMAKIESKTAEHYFVKWSCLVG